MNPIPFAPRRLVLLVALVAASAQAAPTEEQMQAMEARLKAMEARLEAMQKLLDAKGAAAPPAPAAAAAPAAAGAGWGQPVAAGKEAPAKLTQGELDALKQRVARQELRVGKLYDDATTGPLAGLSIGGYVDPAFIVSRNQRLASFHFLDGGDPYTYYNSSIGDVFLQIKKTFGEGTYAPSVDLQLMPYRGYGAFTTNGSGATFGNIFTTALVRIPVSDGGSVTAGYTPSFAGYEYQAATQTLTVSHNLLYDWSAPGTYMGIGYDYWQGNWAFKTFLGNEEYRAAGAAVAGGTNRIPTITGRVDYTWSSALYLGGSFSLGRNSLLDCGDGTYGYQCGSTRAFGKKIYLEGDLTYVTADRQLNAQIDYGQLQNGAWNGGRAVWWGVSLLAHQKWSTAALGRIGASVRFDYLNNARNGGGGGGLYLGTGDDIYGTDTLNGFGISQACLASALAADPDDYGLRCKGANRMAATVAFLVYPTDQITLKAEYRHDWATLPVFARTDGLAVKRNDVFGLQLIYAY